MPDQAPSAAAIRSVIPAAGSGRAGIRLDAAWRLGARPVAFWAADRALRKTGLARLGLPDLPRPAGRFLPAAGPVAPRLPQAAADAVLRAAAALPAAPDWHGRFPPDHHALSLALHVGDGARPVWEASRLGALPVLAMAARLDPAGGHLARAEALLRDWCRANPPFRGVNWACGQEAAFRALHLALALALLEADRAPPPGARALLLLCARRIGATPACALAQDNNHPVSEAAGAYACALLLGRRTRGHAATLSRRVARLVAADGGFAQVSPGYARLLLDTLSVVEWLRRRHGAAPFPAPLAERAAALAAWLHRITDPATGGTPPLGVEDGSCFADLSLRGPADSRGSIERAARLFAGAGADVPDDPGCAWLGLPMPASRLERPARWQAAGTRGWHEGAALAVLRTGPLRFRPSQADLLHLSLRDGATWIVRDGGTGSYDPPEDWWWPALSGTAGHNAPVFDGAEPMPRAGRFLLARWPATRTLPDGAAARDSRGNETRREVHVGDRIWTVEDRLRGPFRRVAWHWRLCQAAWRLHGHSAESAVAAITVEADAPLRLALVEGWESPAYRAVGATPVLLVQAEAPVTRVTTRIRLP